MNLKQLDHGQNSRSLKCYFLEGDHQLILCKKDKSLIALALLVLAAGLAQAGAGDIIGRPDKIVDGDTFWLCDAEKCSKIRVCGIDAPEKGSNAARKSGVALGKLISGKTVRCIPVGKGTVCDGRSRRKSRDRVVAQCFVDGTDIAQSMVNGGHACDWKKFSGGAYSKGRDVCRK